METYLDPPLLPTSKGNEHKQNGAALLELLCPRENPAILVIK
jgi:hypothetical protein